MSCSLVFWVLSLKCILKGSLTFKGELDFLLLFGGFKDFLVNEFVGEGDLFAPFGDGAIFSVGGTGKGGRGNRGKGNLSNISDCFCMTLFFSEFICSKVLSDIEVVSDTVGKVEGAGDPNTSSFGILTLRRY